MYKLSDLIGKEAITLSDAKKQGVIFNAHFDETLRSCKYFTLINHDEEIKWVEYRHVLSHENDAVVIRSSDDLIEAPLSATIPSPINLKAFNQDGVTMGFVRDVEMQDGKTIKFITDSQEVGCPAILSVSEEILVFNDTGKPVKIKPSKKTSKPIQPQSQTAQQSQPQTAQQSQPQTAQQSQPQTNQQPQQQTNQQHTQPQSQQAQPMPQIQKQPQTAPQDIKKISQDNTAVHRSPMQQASSKYSFLLGKRLQRNICDTTGAIIAKENDLITEALIGKAKEKGKLVTLALHSL